MTAAVIVGPIALPGPRRKPDLVLGRDADGFPLPPGAVARLGSLKFRHAWRINDVSCSPDGKTIVSGMDWGPLTFWKSATGCPSQKTKTSLENVKAVSFSADGKHLGVVCHQNAGGGESEKWVVELRHAATGKLIRAFPQAAKKTIISVGFSPEGELLCARLENRLVHVMRAAANKRHCPPLHHKAKVGAVAFSHNGKTVLTASEDNQFHFWNLATGKKFRLLHLAEEPVRNGVTVALSPNQKILAIAASNQCLFFYDAKSGKRLREFSGCNPVALDFSHDGKILAAADHRRIRFWNAMSGAEITSPAGPIDFPETIAISPDGRYAAFPGREHTVRLWNCKTGKPELVLGDLYAPKAITFSPDSRTVLFAGAGGDRRIRAWNVRNGKLGRTFANHKTDVGRLAFSRDGKRLLAKPAYARSTIFEWDAESGKLLKKHPTNPALWWELVNGRRLFHNGWMTNARFNVFDISPNGAILAAIEMSGGPLVLRDVKTGGVARLIDKRPYFGRHDNREIRFTPDGRMLVLTNHRNIFAEFDANGEMNAYSPIILFEAATGNEILSLQGHHHSTTAIDFSAGGRRMVSIGLDNTALVWDMHQLTGAHDNLLKKKDIESFWAALARPDAGAAFAAVEALAAAPRQTIFILNQRLRPVPRPDAAEIRHWISQLDSDNFGIREKATQALAEAGEQAEPYLRAALQEPLALESQMRVQVLIGSLDEEWSKPAPARLRFLRTLMVLERINSSESRQLLAALAGGLPGARTTREAGYALERLSKLHEKNGARANK